MSDELKNKKSDYLLELALEEQLEHDAESKKYDTANEPENRHMFSEEHEKRMQEIFKMVEKADRKPKYAKRYRQMAAGFVLLFCISAFSVTQVEAFRIPIIRFFTEIKEKSTLFGVNKDDDVGHTEKYKEYEPRYIPDGFAVAKINEEKEKFWIEYLNEQKQQAYRYYFFENRKDSAIDTENGNALEIEINGNPAHLIQKEEKIRILLDKDGHYFYLAGNIPSEEALKIMESIQQ